MTRRATRRTQLTIRFDPELAERLQRAAERDALSLNQAAVGMLRKAVGMPVRGPAPDTSWIDRHAGTWTEAEGEQFDRAIAVFEQIDSEMWPAPAKKRRPPARGRP